MTIILELAVGAAILASIALLSAPGRKLFGALKNRAVKGLSDAEKAARDPVADGEAAIAEAEESLFRLRNARRTLNASITKVANRVALAEAEIAKLKTVAEAAAAAKDREAASVALNRKRAAEARLKTLKEELTSSQTLASSYATQITQLQEKIESARANKDNLVVRRELASVRTKLTAELLDNQGIDAKLSRLTEDTEDAEAHVAALDMEQQETDAVNAAVKKYSGGTTSDEEAELDALMALHSGQGEGKGLKLEGDPII